MYVDESGDHTYNQLDTIGNRYLCLSGVIFEDEYYQDVVHPETNRLKGDLFSSHPDEPIIFHREDILHKRAPFDLLQYQDVDKQFCARLLQSFESWNYTLISVVIDKKSHKEAYQNNAYPAYDYSFKVLLERYKYFLHKKKAVGDVMIEARAKGGKEDKHLKNIYSDVYTKGTSQNLAHEFQEVFTSSKPKIKSKEQNITGLQIADLLAHPSKYDVLLTYKHISEEPNNFGGKIIKCIQPKYLRSGWGISKGYGKKML
jgi:hypothetical protein